MSNLEPELQALKENLLEMLEVVTSQLGKCRKAFGKSDPELAKDVFNNEKRVNAMELNIDKDCENILALYNPVATDLRFVLASLKIGNDLERIGDNAKALANFLEKNIKKTDKAYIEKFKIEQMFDIALEMLTDMGKAVREKDTNLAVRILRKDATLNELGKKASHVAEELLKEKPADAKIILRLFSIARRMERVGDLIKNIGEEVVFHVEAKVIKHKQTKKEEKN